MNKVNEQITSKKESEVSTKRTPTTAQKKGWFKRKNENL